MCFSMDLLGARVHVVKDDKAASAASGGRRGASRRRRGVYVVPIGGSNAVGSLGYVDAFNEIEGSGRCDRA